MKALVTGSNGFIGSHLVEGLLSEDISVRCLVRRSSDLSNLANLEVEYHYGDITRPDSLASAVAGVDFVFHLGGLTKAPDERTYFAANAIGTRNLLEAMALHNPAVRRVVIVSSLAAGGPAKIGRPRTEADPDHPVTPYGRSKKAADDIALQFSDKLPVVIVRPPAVYGPREKDIFTFFQTVRRHLRPQIGLMKRELSVIYVTDLVAGLLQTARSPVRSGSLYYIDDGLIYTWNDFSRSIAGALNVRTVPLIVPEFALKTAGYLAETAARMAGQTAVLNRHKIVELCQPSWATNSEKIRRETGFNPRIDLNYGCQLSVTWYRENRWID